MGKNIHFVKTHQSECQNSQDKIALTINKSSHMALSLCPFSRFSPLLAIHICHQRARLPGAQPCSTHGLGPKPEMGIYEATSAHLGRNKSIRQDCVVLATCGGDPAQRRGTNTKQGISFLLQSSEKKLLLCPQASVFMLKGIRTVHKLQLLR